MLFSGFISIIFSENNEGNYVKNWLAVFWLKIFVQMPSKPRIRKKIICVHVDVPIAKSSDRITPCKEQMLSCFCF
jgi:hypothetical protein